MTKAVELAQVASTGVSEAFKNRIINGQMTIDQRNAGASVTPTTDSTYTLDRWVTRLSAASKFSVQQNAGSVTPPAGFRNYLGVTSLAATSVGSTDYYAVAQFIEGFNTADLGFGTANAQTVTLSFWVRSSLTGTFGGYISNDSFGRVYPFTYTISSANTWEQKSVTIAGDTSGTWLTTNGIGIRVQFNLGFGSTFQGAANAWNSSNIFQPTGAVNLVSTNGATWYVTGVQLEVGSSATSFETRSYGTELQLCQRYFYKHASGGSGSNDNIIGGMWYYTSSFALTYVKFPTSMRTNPSAVATSGSGYFSVFANGVGDAFNSLTLNTSSATGIELYNSSEISGTAGQTGGLVGTNASMYLGFSAEL